MSRVMIMMLMLISLLLPGTNRQRSVVRPDWLGCYFEAVSRLSRGLSRGSAFSRSHPELSRVRPSIKGG